MRSFHQSPPDTRAHSGSGPQITEGLCVWECVCENVCVSWVFILLCIIQCFYCKSLSLGLWSHRLMRTTLKLNFLNYLSGKDWRGVWKDSGQKEWTKLPVVNFKWPDGILNNKYVGIDCITETSQCNAIQCNRSALNTTFVILFMLHLMSCQGSVDTTLVIFQGDISPTHSGIQ